MTKNKAKIFLSQPSIICSYRKIWNLKKNHTNLGQQNTKVYATKVTEECGWRVVVADVFDV